VEPEVAILVQRILFGDGFEVFVVVVLGCHHCWDGCVNGSSIDEH
jgi:hypothetical protein